jgi:hypothetical protein
MVVAGLRMRLERSRIESATHFGLQAPLVVAEYTPKAELCESSVTRIVSVLARRLHTAGGNAKLRARMKLPGSLDTRLSDSHQSTCQSKPRALAYMALQTHRGRHKCTASYCCDHPGRIVGSAVHRAAGMPGYFGWGTRSEHENRYHCSDLRGCVVASSLGKLLQRCYKS